MNKYTTPSSPAGRLNINGPVTQRISGNAPATANTPKPAVDTDLSELELRVAAQTVTSFPVDPCPGCGENRLLYGGCCETAWDSWKPIRDVK